MTTFSIEEIRKYLLKQDSLGDVMYNLSEENIIAANKPYPGYLPEILYRKSDGCPFYLNDDGIYTAEDEHGLVVLEREDGVEELLSECCTAPIERGLCTDCNEHV